MSGHAPDGYGDWVVLHIINSMMTAPIEIKNAYLKHGKFHEMGNKDAEISAETVNSYTIAPNTAKDIPSCGRDSALYGTEGNVEVWAEGTKICKLFWSDPFSGNNDFQLQDYKMGPGTLYVVSVGDWNRSGGSLGNVHVEIAKKG
ncbi:hypothetical protein BHYA_0651g00010 [Botrytis hyacinthi]|uniref:Asp-hemolysin n=1 Tax=Botrytis hyacinthi TaxID=278943 RepID=A0A4Z1G8W1_9HELO|nr:hypothetical protein BHYA_0651g00010 [Botrytis hyacinthi]